MINMLTEECLEAFKTGYHLKGEVESPDDLPADAVVGDAYYVQSIETIMLLNTEKKWVPFASNPSILAEKRLAWLKTHARQNTAYDVYGKGGHWSIGFFSPDSSLTFEEAIDAAISRPDF